MRQNMTNTTKTILMLLLGLMMVMPADAQRRNTRGKKKNSQVVHLIDMWGGAGYSGMVNAYNEQAAAPYYDGQMNTKFIGGGGGLIGVGYEMRYKKFMFNVGPEFRIFSSRDNLVFDGQYNIQQPDYTEMMQHYRFTDLRENQVVGQIMVPILAGANFGKYYFLGGVKLGYTVLGSWRQRGNLTTSVTDQMAIEEWTDVPSHYLVTETALAEHPLYKGEAKGKNPFGFDATLSAEFGINIDEFLSEDWRTQNMEKKYPWHMRVGLFVDYGLNNMNVRRGDTPLLAAIPTTAAEGSMWADPTAVSTGSIHQSDWAEGRLNSLLVGAKFTASLQLNKPLPPKAPNPYMVIRLMNARTGEPIDGVGARAEIINKAKPKKITKKAPNQKGFLVQRAAPGDYMVSMFKEGYLPADPMDVLLLPEVNNNLKGRLDTLLCYMTPLPRFSCTVRDWKTNALIPATLEFEDVMTGRGITVAYQDTANIPVSVVLPLGGEYRVKISAPMHTTETFAIGQQTIDDIFREYHLAPLERRRTYIVKNLFFATLQTRILPQSEAALQKLYEFLAENPEVRIRITGHTDWVGTDEDNQKLSEGRSASVKQSMVDRGIDPSRIETDGKGESMPIDTNSTEAGRQNNRRVEITVLNADSDVEFEN